MPHPQYMRTLSIWSGSSSSVIPQVMSDHLGLPPARILVEQFSKNTPLLLRFSLSYFHPSPSYSLAINLPCSCCIKDWTEFLSLIAKPHCSGPYTYICSLYWSKVSLTTFNKHHEYFFFSNSINRKRPEDCLQWAWTSKIGLNEFTTV